MQKFTSAEKKHIVTENGTEHLKTESEFHTAGFAVGMEQSTALPAIPQPQALTGINTEVNVSLQGN